MFYYNLQKLALNVKFLLKNEILKLFRSDFYVVVPKHLTQRLSYNDYR